MTSLQYQSDDQPQREVFAFPYVEHALLLDQARGRHDQLPQRFVVADITGAAAQMAVECVGDDLLDILAGDWLPLELLKQDNRFVDEAGGTVTALKRIIFQKGILHLSEFYLDTVRITHRVAFDSADAFAGEQVRACDTGAHGFALFVGVIQDHHTGMAYALSTSDARPGQIQILMQKVRHANVFWHAVDLYLLPIDLQC